MPGPAESDNRNAEVAVIDPAVVQRFAQMAMAVPSEDGGGAERIIEAILAADSWETLNDPWESSNAEKLRGKRLRIDAINRRPSQFKGGLGIFLVVRSWDLSTGEEIVWTTSSVSVVAQLVRAHLAGWLPAIAEMIIADRPTEAGFYPHHLRFLAGSAPRPAGDEQAAADAS